MRPRLWNARYQRQVRWSHKSSDFGARFFGKCHSAGFDNAFDIVPAVATCIALPGSASSTFHVGAPLGAARQCIGIVVDPRSLNQVSEEEPA